MRPDTSPRTRVVCTGYGAFSTQFELAELLDGTYLLWASGFQRGRVVGTYATEREGMDALLAYTTPIAEVR